MREISLLELQELLSELWPQIYNVRCSDPQGDNARAFVQQAIGVAQFIVVKELDAQDRSRTS